MTFSKMKFTQHFVSFSLLCTLLATAYLAYMAYGTNIILAKISSGHKLPAEELHILIQSLASIESFGGIILILTSISMLSFLIWLYKSYKNLLVLNKVPAKFSPGWAVGWFFVPILNLYKPYQVITELWNESFKNSSKQGFAVKQGPTIIKIWWLTNVASQITSLLTNGAASQVKNIQTLPFAEIASHYLALLELITISSILSVFVVAGFIFVVFNINEIQRSSHQGSLNSGGA
ncbi:DUF4328 domain-containing protein [Dendrosporobacter sp. 1207_IL3150]|uniref:DUF4328 domain-containing protein n=1 Tax=Dendrosporobacter sp. 1207_IL3150 TaxID=3084054 RepID=UPI002FDA5693